MIFYAVSFSMVLPDGAPRLLLRLSAGEICEPGFFKWSDLSYLRSRSHTDRDGSGFLQRQSHSFIPGVNSAGNISGMGDRFLPGEDFPSQMVGLFEHAAKYRRICLSAFLCGMGHCCVIVVRFLHPLIRLGISWIPVWIGSLFLTVFVLALGLICM